MSDLLTIEQVAERLQVSKRTVRRAIDERGLRAVQVAGRGTWRVRVCDLDEWLEQRASVSACVSSRAARAAAAAIAPSPRPRRSSSDRLTVTAEMGKSA